MGYLTVTELKLYGVETTLDQLCDAINSPPDVDSAEGTAVANRAIDAASEWIDSYMVRKTSTPVVPIPTRLKDLCGEAVWFLLYQWKEYSEETNPRGAGHKMAQRWLMDFSLGRVHLKLADDTQVPLTPRMASNSSGTSVEPKFNFDDSADPISEW